MRIRLALLSNSNYIANQMLKPLLLLIAVKSCVAQDGQGMLGLGLTRYNPVCAAACTTGVQTAPLSCTLKGQTFRYQMSYPNTPPSCFASNEPYLTTNAYCIQTHCQGEEIAVLEHFWKTKITLNNNRPPFPKWTYQEALAQIKGTPRVVVSPWQPLNETSILDEAGWKIYRDTLSMDEIYEEKASVYSYVVPYNFVSRAGRFISRDLDVSEPDCPKCLSLVEQANTRIRLVVVVTVLCIPLVLTLFHKILPRPSSAAAKFKSIFIIPALWGRRFREPTWAGLGLQPTRGLAILVLYTLVINFLLSVVDYPIAQPNVRYKTKDKELMMGIGLRVGLLSFANMALTIFLAGRNTLLLWLTDWSRSTYLLLHRWVAYVSIIQAAIHCLVYLRHYVSKNMYLMHVVMEFFIWGTVTMLAMVFLWLFSVLPIRQRFYEVFLLGHIVFAIITLVGCWYHIWALYGNLWGFEMWLYACFAAWSADRAFRIIRMAKWGIKKATITRIDDDYIRIDIPEVNMEGHAFLYFPTLSWRFWENHPLSIASSIGDLSLSRTSSAQQSPIEESESGGNLEKDSKNSSTNVVTTSRGAPVDRLTFFCRVAKGMTSKLAMRAGMTIPILIEGGYSKVADTESHSQLIAIAGGVGITTILTALRKHPGRAKLYWGVRNTSLVDHIRDSGLLDGIEVAEISVGKRLDISSILNTEIDGGVKYPMVLVSGPQSMADDVRATTVEIMRKTGINVKLLDESFSW
jgi:predicted ferric reductase